MTDLQPSFARTPDSLVPEDDESEGAETVLNAALIAATMTMEAMTRDWAKLNGYLSATATRYGWCGDFEERLSRYNETFETLRLEGRNENQRRGENDPYNPWKVNTRNPNDFQAKELLALLKQIKGEIDATGSFKAIPRQRFINPH